MSIFRHAHVFAVEKDNFLLRISLLVLLLCGIIRADVSTWGVYWLEVLWWHAGYCIFPRGAIFDFRRAA